MVDGCRVSPWTRVRPRPGVDLKGPSEPADKKVGEVCNRVGDNLRRFLVVTAQNCDCEGFTMEDAAGALGATAKTVRSWHRNLGRTLRQVDEALPEPRLMQRRSDGQRNLHWYDPEVRSAILASDMLSGRR